MRFCSCSFVFGYDDAYFVEAENGFLANEVEDASKAVSMVEASKSRAVQASKIIRVPLKVTRKSDGNYFMWSDMSLITFNGEVGFCIDPLIKINMSAKEMDTALNKQSGLLGISGISSDSRDVEDGIANGNERCILAQNMYVRRIINYIAMYFVEMGGADAIVFTAGVGENSVNTRKQIIDGLYGLGIKLDEEANNCRGKEVLISTDDSLVKCYVIPTDEELMIARDTYELV